MRGSCVDVGDRDRCPVRHHPAGDAGRHREAPALPERRDGILVGVVAVRAVLQHEGDAVRAGQPRAPPADDLGDPRQFARERQFGHRVQQGIGDIGHAPIIVRPRAEAQMPPSGRGRLSSPAVTQRGMAASSHRGPTNAGSAPMGARIIPSTMSPRVARVREPRCARGPTMASPPARFMITQRVAWRDSHTAKGALRWRWGTVAAVALSKMDDGRLAYEYLIAGGDGAMYLRWDHQLDASVRRRSRPVPREPRLCRRPAPFERQAAATATAGADRLLDSPPVHSVPASTGPTTGSGRGSSSPLTSGWRAPRSSRASTWEGLRPAASRRCRLRFR